MATLILSAVGTAVGGPLGGAVGALLGRAVDTSVIGRPTREGLRLVELAVTTSSYGQPVPRVYGTMRMPGTIIWATDLVESSTTSGGKGQPKTKTYSYSMSFAVALSSRPIASIGRIWADGALLRGAAGDLKVGGTMRLHAGDGDQPVDPAIAADRGAQACAFRGLSYAVFEDLDLSSFGNRIPALSFEVVGPDGALDLVDLLAGAKLTPDTSVPMTGLRGYADQGGTRTVLLNDVARVFPFAVTTTADAIALAPIAGTEPSLLPVAVAGRAESEERAEPILRRGPIADDAPHALRYYDPARDFQPSLQRAPGASGSEGAVVEFGGAFAAPMAQARIAEIRRQASSARETLAYRIAELAPEFAPGRCVLREGDQRIWRVLSCESHADGVDLRMARVVRATPGTALADPGNALIPPDDLPGDLRLRYLELPWDGTGANNVPMRYAAISMSGTRGSVALFGMEGESLVPLGLSTTESAVQGHSLSALGVSPALLIEPGATLDLALWPPDAQLQSVDERTLLNGANRLLLGEEILQFRQAEPTGNGHWRLTGLLRGRGGTEHLARLGHGEGTPAVLLDERLLPLGEQTFLELAAQSSVGAAEPSYAELVSPGTTLRPLAPVHPCFGQGASGDPEWHWIRRARGAWRWLDGVETPLVEEREAYRVGFGPVAAPVSLWDTPEPHFSLPLAEWAALCAAFPTEPLWVRQIGSHAVSLPTLLPR